ncbi:MAG: signal peptidase II [Blautia sp.]|nr:signal peptidase II [Blautia sp.]MDY4516032.1 signal peptidase II [Lachnospiraceae bacterium]
MIYLFIPLLIFGVDIIIKGYMEERKPDGYQREILGGRILLCKSHNQGAMLNLLEKHRQLVAGFSLGLTVCLVAAHLYLSGKKGMHLLKCGLAFVIGGACSNVYDRMVRHYVVDYFSFRVKWEKLRKIVFNLGDLFIFLGTFFIILWNTLRKS